MEIRGFTVNIPKLKLEKDMMKKSSFKIELMTYWQKVVGEMVVLR